jgi:maltose O-acetyltransferase
VESHAITAMKKAREAGAKIGEGTLIFGEIDLVRPSLITIGSKSMIATHAMILCHGYPLDWFPVTIGDNCYIGWGALILPGAVIGNNCVVGAGAVVPKSTHIPDWSFVVGNPACVKPLNRERHKIFVDHMEQFVAITSK